MLVISCFNLPSTFTLQKERQKDKVKQKKRKESDLPSSVMQINKYVDQFKVLTPVLSNKCM